jgi:hypothetical protein
MTKVDSGFVTSFMAVKAAKVNFTKLKMLLAYDEIICYKQELPFLKSNICHDKELLLLPCKVIQGIY